MELSKAWIAYCEPKVAPDAEAEPFSPDLVMERLWLFNPLFTARFDAITATDFSTVFDEEADGALMDLAWHDRIAWDGLSVGAWRVLFDRHEYALIVAMANKTAGVAVIAGLPRGLSEEEQSRALLLQFLLGGARTIDRRLLPKSRSGRVPPIPGTTLLRQQ